MIEGYQAVIVVIAALVAGLTQVVKSGLHPFVSEAIQDAVIPVLAVLIGVVLGMAAAGYYGQPMFEGLINGLIGGLTAVGVYGGAKKVARSLE